MCSFVAIFKDSESLFTGPIKRSPLFAPAPAINRPCFRAILCWLRRLFWAVVLPGFVESKCQITCCGKLVRPGRRCGDNLHEDDDRDNAARRRSMSRVLPPRPPIGRSPWNGRVAVTGAGTCEEDSFHTPPMSCPQRASGAAAGPSRCAAVGSANVPVSFSHSHAG